jgi:hypothetical protein
VLQPPIALQRFAHRLFVRFDARVPQSGQLSHVGLPVHNGIHDGETGQSGDVADYVMNLHIHLRQRFLHMLDMLVGHLHQIVAVPRQRPHCADIAVGSKGRSQQSHRMQKLQSPPYSAPASGGPPGTSIFVCGSLYPFSLLFFPRTLPEGFLGWTYDIGAREIFVAVPSDRDENPVRGVSNLH